MLIDLDAPIHLVPCGVPGDLDALSGHAHICSDRTRLAMTECKPVTVCLRCLDQTTPRWIDCRFKGVLLCPGYEWLWGDINGEHRLEQTGDPCMYRTVEAVGEIEIWGEPVPIYAFVWFHGFHVAIFGGRAFGAVMVFEQFVSGFPPYDCMKQFIGLPNRLTLPSCGAGVLGYDGTVNVIPAR